MFISDLTHLWGSLKYHKERLMSFVAVRTTGRESCPVFLVYVKPKQSAVSQILTYSFIFPDKVSMHTLIQTYTHTHPEAFLLTGK